MMQKVWAWICILFICLVMLAVLVGLFFLKSYRWGNCS